jgi:uncharacterized protein YdhG (YjbR/CyaY superfamily)
LRAGKERTHARREETEAAMNAKKESAKRSGTEAAAAIERYIAAAPEPARKLLTQIREVVRAAAPREAEEIFSYGMPGFQYKGRLLWYGAFKQHVGFYPGSPPMLQSIADDLKGYRTSKGAVQFPLDKPLPVALVKKIVMLRVAENEARKRKG